MKSCLIGATHNISANIASHKSAWAHMWYEQLKLTDENIEIIYGKIDDLSEYDVVYIDQGMEFSGSLNLFGGANDVSWAHRLLSIKGSIVSLDRSLADYGELGKTRLKSCSQEWSNFDWDSLSALCAKSSTLTQSDRATGKLCFGDSHSFSALPDLSYMACRNDGLTLHGALNRGIRSYIEPFGELTDLTVYLGNIDIRHHLRRQPDPMAATEKLVARLEEDLKSLDVPNIEIVGPLPIEDESRVLPKTGYYKGTPFYGSQAERNAVMVHFQDQLETMCKNNQFSLFTWPKQWFTIAPIKFMDYMERPRSVHLSREYYRWQQPENSLESFF